ncbi:MAG: hypothetical protein JWR05_95 [Mucilaginibacter sp.]|nr:hypothetical protein [Mucilaginibacter sp.]
MIKWFLYIVLLMIFAPRLSSANNTGFRNFFGDNISLNANYALQRDTVATKTAKQRQVEEEKKKIKEIAKAKKMPKPEKVEEVDPKNTKPKRQRRPDGLERPPEIPRRNNN